MVEEGGVVGPLPDEGLVGVDQAEEEDVLVEGGKFGFCCDVGFVDDDQEEEGKEEKEEKEAEAEEEEKRGREGEEGEEEESINSPPPCLLFCGDSFLLFFGDSFLLIFGDLRGDSGGCCDVGAVLIQREK